MGPNESALESILDEPEWDAPALEPLEEARTAFHGLPEPVVPGWFCDKLAQAKVAGESNVVIEGAAYVAEGFVSIFEGWLAGTPALEWPTSAFAQ